MPAIRFSTIKEVLSQPVSAHFRVKYADGVVQKGDDVSFFNGDASDEKLTFDISNNKVLVNMGMNGSIRQATIYRGCYLADSIPGVWYRKDFCQTGRLAFTLELEGETCDLSKVDWPFETSLLDNIFPVTRLKGEKVSVTLTAFSPISEDGKQRLRAAVYGALICNTSGERVRGTLFLPSAYEGDIYSGINDTATGGACISLADFAAKPKDVPFDYWPNCMAYVPEQQKVDFDLAPGEDIWVPAVISDFGGDAAGEIEKYGTLYWLNSTWSYFKALTGSFCMPDDKFTEEFFQRAVLQCFGSLGMDGEGRLAGSNWGSYPATANIWMKDMYYSLIPFSILDTELIKEGILWFADRSVRPRGNRGVGGVRHSLSNSLSPVAMAGLYFRCTGDSGFFFENIGLKSKLDRIMQEVLDSRESGDVWLFPSVWLSDGPAYGDYHTGSNLLAWYSFKAYADILEKVFGDSETAAFYRMTAGRIRDAIEEKCIIDGPFGKQYIEGVNKDGSIPWMIHEGEESETTLLPFYGYLDFDDQVYRNYMRFTVSEHNEAYNPETKGTQWQGKKGRYTDATLPGYIAGFACIEDAESMNGANGYMTELRRLTDVDGSLWWWPYDRQDSKYGRVSRGPCGKCGWASGEFICLFVTQFLGLRYYACEGKLRFRPFSPSGSFSWTDFRLGGALFDVSYTKGPDEAVLTVCNRNDRSIGVEFEVLAEDGGVLDLDGIAEGAASGSFMGKPTVKAEKQLGPRETVTIRVKGNHS